MFRWGIVGFGWVARDFMAPGILAAGDRIVGVCDPDPRAHDAARRLGARPCVDLDELLRERPDAIYVATPNHLHRHVVETCMSAGVPVLCEKPMAASLADAEAMVGAAQATGTLLGLALDQRHHPAHVAMRSAIATGLVGTPTAVRIVYGCWLDREWSPDRSEGVDNWRIDKARAGGGAVIDLAPHGLDLAAMLLDEPIIELAGFLQNRIQTYPVDDGGILVGRTASGALLSLHNSYNTPEKLPRRRLEVVGTRGQLSAQNTMGQEAGGTVHFTAADDGGMQAIEFDAALSPFTVQARSFADAVRGAAHAYDPARDLAALKLLLAVDAELSASPLEAAA